MVLARLPRLRSGADPADRVRRHLPRRRGRRASSTPPTRRPRPGAARRDPVRGVLPLADRPVGPRARPSGPPGCTRSPCSGCTRRPSCSATTRWARGEEAVRRVVAQLDAHLEEPLLDCLARDALGRPVPAGGLTAGRRGVPGHARRPHLPRRPLLAGRRGRPRRSGTWGVATGHPRIVVGVLGRHRARRRGQRARWLRRRPPPARRPLRLSRIGLRKRGALARPTGQTQAAAGAYPAGVLMERPRKRTPAPGWHRPRGGGGRVVGGVVAAVPATG